MKSRDLQEISLLGILAATGGVGFLQVYKRATGLQEIFEYPDPILRQISSPVNAIDNNMVALSRQMITMVRYFSLIGFFSHAQGR